MRRPGSATPQMRLMPRVGHLSSPRFGSCTADTRARWGSLVKQFQVYEYWAKLASKPLLHTKPVAPKLHVSILTEVIVGGVINIQWRHLIEDISHAELHRQVG